MPTGLTVIAAVALLQGGALPTPPLSEQWGPERVRLRDTYWCGGRKIDIEAQSDLAGVRITALSYEDRSVAPAMLSSLNARLAGLLRLRSLSLRCGADDQSITVQGTPRQGDRTLAVVTLSIRGGKLLD
jgi:hypothetical protein